MSTFNIKSEVLAKRDSLSARTLTDAITNTGIGIEVVGVEKTTNNASDIGAAGTTIRLIKVPSSCRLASLEYASVALGTSALDIAVWYPTVIQPGLNTPAVSSAATLISSSTFAANLNPVDGTGVAWTDALGLNSVVALNKRAQPLWQLIGLSTDPGIDLDLGFTVRTAVAINGYVGLRARYVD